MKIVLKANSPLSLFSGILTMKGLENIPLATYPLSRSVRVCVCTFVSECVCVCVCVRL